MLKPLTLSLSLAVALCVCSVSKAGGLFHGDSGCTTCGIASPQGPAVSPQAPCPSPQGCVEPCKPKCSLFSGLGHKMNCGLDNLSCGMKDLGCGFKDLCGKLKPKPKCYTYEWVLKKKRVWGCHGNCGSPSCDTCGVYPSGQGAPAPSGQAGYTSPQAYGTGQIAAAGQAGSLAPAPAPVAGGDEAPPAPEVAPAAPAAPRAPTAPAPVPPAPPAPPAPGATSGLLFSTPSGN